MSLQCAVYNSHLSTFQFHRSFKSFFTKERVDIGASFRVKPTSLYLFRRIWKSEITQNRGKAKQTQRSVGISSRAWIFDRAEGHTGVACFFTSFTFRTENSKAKQNFHSPICLRHSRLQTKRHNHSNWCRKVALKIGFSWNSSATTRGLTSHTCLMIPEASSVLFSALFLRWTKLKSSCAGTKDKPVSLRTKVHKILKHFQINGGFLVGFKRQSAWFQLDNNAKGCRILKAWYHAWREKESWWKSKGPVLSHQNIRIRMRGLV